MKKLILKYTPIVIVLILIIFFIWLVDKGYIDTFFSDIFSSESSEEDYNPGECFPYGSCE